MKKTDIMLLSNLRQDGRMALTDLSRKAKLPISTLHERLKKHTQEKTIKPTILLNFQKIGYTTRAHILLSVEPTQKEQLYQHLKNHPNVNTLYRINNGWNLIMECIFKDMHAIENFLETLETNYQIKQKQIHYTLDEYKREQFMAEPNLAEQLFQ